MSNKVIAIIMKAVGIFYAVLCGIFAIIVFFAFVALSSSSEDFFKVLLMIILYGIVGFIGLATFFGFANALNDLEELKQTNYQLLEQNRKLLNALGCSDSAISSYNLSEIAANSKPSQNNSNNWICPQCGQSNDHSQRCCKGCGNQI